MNLLLAAALALLTPDLPKYWSVHIDTPRREARATFEQVDIDNSAAVRELYTAGGGERPPSWIFSTADGVYYSLRGRASLADLERPSPKGLAEKTAPISARAHATLATHHNEIWRTEKDFTRLPDAAAPKYARIRVDRVAPPNEDRYEAAMKELCDDCAKRGIRVIAFFSAYGDGAYRYLFLSDQPIRVRRLGSLAATREVDARARPDLTLTEAERWIR